MLGIGDGILQHKIVALGIGDTDFDIFQAFVQTHIIMQIHVCDSCFLELIMVATKYASIEVV